MKLRKKRTNGIKTVCQCTSFFCLKRIKLSHKEAEELFAISINMPEAIVISNKCKHGPDPTDKLIKRHEKYSIYIDENVGSKKREEK